MRVKYGSDKNIDVLFDFFKFVVKNYLFAMIVNFVLALILVKMSSASIIRVCNDGVNTLTLFEALTVPLSIIPIINLLNSFVMIFVGSTKIIMGDYVVNRYRILKKDYNKIFLTDNNFYKNKNICASSLKVGRSVDVVYISNNYGCLIWAMVVNIKTRDNVPVIERYSSDFIFQPARRKAY